MATNLLIGYPDIPSRSVISSSSVVQNSRYPYKNLFGGNKTDIAKADTSSAASLSISLTSNDTTGNTCNFLYIGNAALLEACGCTNMTLSGKDTVPASYTTVEAVNLAAATFYGPAQDDYISIFAETPTYKYWKLDYTNGAGVAVEKNFQHSKVFWGLAFDPGIDPNAPASITKVSMTGSQRRATHTFEFSWNGMPYTKAVEMYQKFFRPKKYQPVILMTRDWHDILMGHRVIFCRIIDITLPPRITDYCNVRATFEEMP